jgi:hypothetical protein
MPLHALPLLSVVLLAVLPAQAVNEQAAGRPARAPFVFEAGRVELRQLVHRCSTYLRRNIVLDDAELLLQGTHGGRAPRGAAPAADPLEPPVVELTQPVITDEAGCEELLTGLLWMRGLALVPIDEAKGVYEILAMNGSRAREISMRAALRTVDQVLARPALKQFVTVVHQLQHTSAASAANSLRSFFASGNPQPTLLAIGTAGHPMAVLLAGPQDQVANAVRLLQAVDQPVGPESAVLQEQSLQQLHRQLDEVRKRIAALEERLAAK